MMILRCQKEWASNIVFDKRSAEATTQPIMRIKYFPKLKNLPCELRPQNQAIRTSFGCSVV